MCSVHEIQYETNTFSASVLFFFGFLRRIYFSNIFSFFLEQYHLPRNTNIFLVFTESE